MIAINLDKVVKSYGTQLVLDGACWEIHQGTKIGLVGANGAGKSTLLKLIVGEEEPTRVPGQAAGTIYRMKNLTIGYMAQEPALQPGRTVLEEALLAVPAIADTEAELADLEAQMADPAVYADADRLARVLDQHAATLDRYRALGGETYASRVQSTLRDLGLSEDQWDQPVETLSGGEKKLVALVRLLVARPDVLLLDEPDNHLDLAAKRRLERLIPNYDGTVVLISHDRYMLDLVVDEIAEVEDHRVTVYGGNYSEYAYEKKTALLRQQQLYGVQQNEIRRLEQSRNRLMEWARRSGGNPKFVRRARNIQKRLDRMDRIDRPILERKRMGLALSANGRGSQKALELVGVEKAFGDVAVLRGVDMRVWAGERVGMLGPNGAGKSLLFRIILGEEESSAGVVKVGPSSTIGYYAQEHETLDVSRTPVEMVRGIAPMYEEQAYGFLGRFLFDYHMARKPIAELSGGEKSRLQLAQLVLEEPNLLLLDEPTNNLDLASCEVLEDALEDYTGTVVAISHDRYFLDRIAARDGGRIVELDEGRVTEYAGGYTYYAEKKEIE